MSSFFTKLRNLFPVPLSSKHSTLQEIQELYRDLLRRYERVRSLYGEYVGNILPEVISAFVDDILEQLHNVRNVEHMLMFRRPYSMLYARAFWPNYRSILKFRQELEKLREGKKRLGIFHHGDSVISQLSYRI